MPRTRPAYPLEYRQRLIELVRAGRSPEDLAKKFEPTAQTIRNWVKQAELDEGVRDDGLTSEEREELQRLRREVRALREEKEILVSWDLRGSADPCPDGVISRAKGVPGASAPTPGWSGSPHRSSRSRPQRPG